MPSDRSLRLIHTPFLALITIVSLIATGISGYLVGFYNNHGYPGGGYKPRIRVCLVAAVWSSFFGIYLLVGFLIMASSILFGVLAHWVALTIGFILFLIGSASLTALTDKIDCGDVVWRKCNWVKGLVVVSWIDTILIFILWIFITLLAFKARGGLGTRRSSLPDVWEAW